MQLISSNFHNLSIPFNNVGGHFITNMVIGITVVSILTLVKYRTLLRAHGRTQPVIIFSVHVNTIINKGTFNRNRYHTPGTSFIQGLFNLVIGIVAIFEHSGGLNHRDLHLIQCLHSPNVNGRRRQGRSSSCRGHGKGTFKGPPHRQATGRVTGRTTYPLRRERVRLLKIKNGHHIGGETSKPRSRRPSRNRVRILVLILHLTRRARRRGHRRCQRGRTNRSRRSKNRNV